MAFDNKGRLYVDFSLVPVDQMKTIVLSMMQQGGGLNADNNGKLYVDFESMPTDKFKAMLRSIRVPVWINGTTYFYVNKSTGSDTLDAGRGQTSSKPFKTIQACIDYVTENYNLSKYNIGIRIAAGVYEEELELRNFNATTGSISLMSYPNNYEVIIRSTNATTVIGSGGYYKLSGVRLELLVDKNDTNPNTQFFSVISTSESMVDVDGCEIFCQYSGETPTAGRYIRMLTAQKNGILRIVSTTKPHMQLEYHRGNATSLVVLYSERGGLVEAYSTNADASYVDKQCWGEASCFAYASSTGNISMVGGGTYYPTWSVPSGKVAIGKRYECQYGGTIVVGNKGPNYFPGDIAGTVDASTYCFYK